MKILRLLKWNPLMVSRFGSYLFICFWFSYNYLIKHFCNSPFLDWSTDEQKILLNNMRTQLPKNDTTKYDTGANHLNWEAVQFADHNANDCRKQWDILRKKVTACYDTEYCHLQILPNFILCFFIILFTCVGVPLNNLSIYNIVYTCFMSHSQISFECSYNNLLLKFSDDVYYFFLCYIDSQLSHLDRACDRCGGTFCPSRRIGSNGNKLSLRCNNCNIVENMSALVNVLMSTKV